MLMFFASAFGFLKRIPWQVFAAIALAAVWYIDRDNYGDAREYEGRAAIIAQWEKANKEAEAKQAESATQATAERIIETRTITIKQKARDHAIQATEDGKPSAVSNALNCVRLQQAGTDLRQFPACRGHEGGGQAAADTAGL